MEDWRGYPTESRPDSSPSSLLDGGASDVVSYTQRSQAADNMFLTQQQQQQQHQQGLQQQFMQHQYVPQQLYSTQQQPGYPSQPGESMQLLSPNSLVAETPKHHFEPSVTSSSV